MIILAKTFIHLTDHREHPRSVKTVTIGKSTHLSTSSTYELWRGEASRFPVYDLPCAILAIANCFINVRYGGEGGGGHVGACGTAYRMLSCVTDHVHR